MRENEIAEVFFYYVFVADGELPPKIKMPSSLVMCTLNVISSFSLLADEWSGFGSG